MNFDKLYILVDIGCIECGEESNVLGIYTDKQRAEGMKAFIEEKYDKEGKAIGTHYFKIFEKYESDINKTILPYYVELEERDDND